MDTQENLNVMRGADNGGSVPVRSAEGITRRVESAQRVGRAGLASGRSRMFSYDRVQGLARAQLKSEFDQADRMPEKQAVEVLNTMHVAYGVANEVEGYLYDFDHALFLCYAMNGSSQLGPYDRVTFRVVRYDDQGGGSRNGEFDYKAVRTVLGVDFRRFFRTYANDVIDACKQLYYHCDFEDPVQVDLRDRMIMLANGRALSRSPYLIADCAEAATNITDVEYASIVNSKAAIVGGTTNAVDQMNSAVPIRSSDNYDSSVGHNVSVGNDIHAGGSRYRS